MKFYFKVMNDLGSFLYSLPSFYSIYKKYKEPISLILPTRMERFKGITLFLESLDFIEKISYKDNINNEHEYICNVQQSSENGPTQQVWLNFYDHLKKYLNFELDTDFTLIPKFIEIDNIYENKIIVGDRWNYSPYLDRRRRSNIIQQTGKFNTNDYHFLDYNQDLLYNVNLIIQNPNTFHTTYTGIATLINMMRKDMVVYWNEEILNFYNSFANDSNYFCTEKKFYDIEFLHNRQFNLKNISFKKI